jgi:tripartite-type tricarboxylate transporter receptor subunit TctC
MRFSRRAALFSSAATFALACASLFPIALPGNEARSQRVRTIKIVVPLAPGGAADILARILGEQISRGHGVTFVTENRPGAGTIVGTEAVSRAAPDGNTLLLTATGIVISPHLRKLTYDPITGFSPVCQLTSTPLVFVVNSGSPYRSLAEFLDAARRNPGAVTVAGVPATISQIAFEMLKHAANVEMTFVPYSGGAPAVNALLGGHVTAVALPYAGMGEQLSSGQLRALASAARERTKLLPDLPTVGESGYKDFVADFWNGLFAPPGTPKEMISQLADWFTAAMETPQVRANIEAQGFQPIGICGAEFAEVLRKQYDDFGRVIREAKIRAD